jgi:protein arginine kinase activator
MVRFLRAASVERSRFAGLRLVPAFAELTPPRVADMIDGARGAPAANGCGRGFSMLCERCSKNVATVHLTEIVKNQKTEKHLCEQCAKEEGYTIKTHVSLQDLLTAFISAHSDATELAEVSCPDCGMGYVDFRNEGRLGCPNDYEVFREALDPLLEKVHGHLEHMGKLPSRAGESQRKQRDLMTLRRRLHKAVEREDYEEAAKLRDLIKEKETADGTA